MPQNETLRQIREKSIFPSRTNNKNRSCPNENKVFGKRPFGPFLPGNPLTEKRQNNTHFPRIWRLNCNETTCFEFVVLTKRIKMYAENKSKSSTSRNSYGYFTIAPSARKLVATQSVFPFSSTMSCFFIVYFFCSPLLTLF